MMKDEVGGECSTHWRDQKFVAIQKFIWCSSRNAPPRRRRRENVDSRWYKNWILQYRWWVYILFLALDFFFMFPLADVYLTTVMQ